MQRKQLNRSVFLLIHQLLKWQNYYIRFAYSTFLIFLTSVGFCTPLYFLWDSFTYMVCKYIYTLFAIEIRTNVLYISKKYITFYYAKNYCDHFNSALMSVLYLNLLFYCYFISCLYLINKHLNQQSLMQHWMGVGLLMSKKEVDIDKNE